MVQLLLHDSSGGCGGAGVGEKCGDALISVGR